MYVQDVPNLWDSEQSMSIKELAGYKMIIVPEGNDVATGLKWALLSTSAVVMPKPRVVGWLMEDMLVPWTHFIPVEEDFSDLEEKVKWCLKNSAACEDIGLNGRCYILQFLDTQREESITLEVLKRGIAVQQSFGLCT